MVSNTFIRPPPKPSLSVVQPTNMPMVAGREAMDWAKMMGMTPDMFTFMGMWLD